MSKANFSDLPDSAFVRQPKALEVVPFSAATLWRKVKEGTFPAPVKLSARVTCWRVSDVRQWMAAQSEQAYTPMKKLTKKAKLTTA